MLTNLQRGNVQTESPAVLPGKWAEKILVFYDQLEMKQYGKPYLLE